MGNNYTVTIARDDLHNSDVLTWKDLHAVDFTFDSPFVLELIQEQTFIADKVVRVLPKKRLVAFGTWQEKPAVAKIFFDPQHAKRHMEEDLAGIQKLQENKVPTPPLYYYGICKDKRIYVLISAQIYGAKNLDQIWQERKTVDGLLLLMQSMIVELATQHVVGILQHDLHLKNFLIGRKKIYTLDGAEVELLPPLLPKKVSMHNLALFLSQFGVGLEEFQEKLFKHYAKSRGWLLKKEDTVELFLMIKKWNHERWQQYEKKIFRDCSQFACLQDFRSFSMVDRKYVLPEFSDFLKDPELAFNHATTKVLKAGRSSTVVSVILDNRQFVVKRYNLKDFWHRLRRSLRPTRASVSWRLAHKLSLFGVLTAKPVAFIEKKCLGFRGKSYYVTEYVSGEHAGEFLVRHQDREDKITAMAKRITSLLKNIAKVEITHGDLKITNILVDVRERPVLIDLDGAMEHVSLSSLRSAWRKEIRRFLENFRDNATIKDKFKAEFGG